MSIGSSLSSALSGLQLASRRAEVTANNIANASNEGYARQEVVSSLRVAGDGAATGIQLDGITRVTDAPLTAKRRGSDARAEGDAITAQAGRQLASFVGGADDPDALFVKIDDLGTKLRSLAETPESSAQHERTFDSLKQVASTFNSIEESIATVRADVDRDIDIRVDALNASLTQIAELNNDIASSVIGGRETAGIEQQRDDAIDAISGQLSIRLMDRGNGAIAIYTKEGVALLEGTSASTIEFTRSPVIDANQDYRAGAGSLSGLTINGVDIAPGSGAAQSIREGGLAGLFEVRDGLSLDALDEVDQVATDLAGRFEAAGLTDGSGRGLFTDQGAVVGAAPARGISGRFEVNDLLDPDQGGAVFRLRDGLSALTQGPGASSVIPQALLDALNELRTPGGALNTAESASGQASELSTLFESRAQRLEDSSATSHTQRSALSSAETQMNGVDLDQQLQDLIQIEQAYAANARVVEVADRLIQRLMEI